MNKVEELNIARHCKKKTPASFKRWVIRIILLDNIRLKQYVGPVLQGLRQEEIYGT